MIKRITLSIILLFAALSLWAQIPTGGVKGVVVSRDGRVPVPGAEVVLSQGGVQIAGCTTGDQGAFLIEALANGMYSMTITANGFVSTEVNVTVDDGFVKDMMRISMTPELMVAEVDDSSFVEFDMDDSGYTDNPTIMYGTTDVFTSVAGYGFSSIRFKNRGYESESQDVYLAGVKMNDAITGYSPFSLWSGLNEAMRSKETTIGMESAEYGLGHFNGTTNLLGNPSAVRPGWRFSLLSNSALYRLRLMANYASGDLDNGLSYAINVSVRAGGNDWIDGVYYKNFSYYAGIEKKFNDNSRLALFTFANTGQRGAQNASTQEVYDLMGTNLYNSNWGYQNGVVRNARVRKTFEPVTVLKYTASPTDKLDVAATLLYRCGWNGYTALDWYDAPDPRPDYYRNLPSYFYMDDDDYNRLNEGKYNWALESWSNHSRDYANYQHINWDRLYNVNYNQADGRSKYAQEQRHVDQRDLNLAASMQWYPTDQFTLQAGLSGKINRTENYKKIADLLGGQYYLNIDQFAERDFASNEALIQNDLDYFLANGSAEKVVKGGKYGYDYYAHVRKGNLWVNGIYTVGGLTASLGASLGYETFWREGLMRKGLFAGLDDNGREITYQGKTLTTYDNKGQVISSKGNSDKCKFLTYSTKMSLAYLMTGGHRFSLNAGYFADAPTFTDAFVSPRTRNTIIDGLTTQKTMSADVNYQWGGNGYSVRVTGYWTKIKDQTDLMSVYDDSQQSFVNFAMTGIEQRHLGLEVGAKMPLPVQGLSLSGVLSLGEYIYTSNPTMTMTIDNSADVIYENVEIPYWQGTPKYRHVNYNGERVIEFDVRGDAVIDGYTKHHVPSTPELATALALNYRTRSYWFFELTGQFFAKSYLDMNPLYRTNIAVGGADGIITPEEVEYMTEQEEFDPAFLLNLSIGKSWYIHRKYNIGFSLNAQNLLNELNVKTGGYEQNRLISSLGKDRYYRFNSKYFYMPGANYMLNLYFRF
ncbi:MAG: TonB-dependent receptor [Bacteroidales bacterium]|nr:TonB-dependent receptor [Bacteroidales bacterium]